MRIKKTGVFRKMSLIGFLSMPWSKTSYHARKDWVLYQIKLVTWVPVKFKQKNNIDLNGRLDPQISISFSACNRYEKWFLYCLVSDFLCWKYIQTRIKQIIIYKYKTSEMSRTTIVKFGIYITYLSKWRSTIPKNFPVLLYMKYSK